MNNKLSGVKDTLFIPLVARAYVSDRFPDYFYDEKALSIQSNIPSNLITQRSSEYSMMASASRAVIMDKAVTAFIQKHSVSNVVCIGCGLETMVFRLSDLSDKVHFYEIDFPTVIENRRDVLGVCQNETLIAADANELEFAQHIDCALPTIFVVAGVFQYFKEPAVLTLISKLQKQFHNAELLFDAADSFGVKYAERYVKKTGNQDAMMYFYIDDAKAFEKKAKLKLLSVKGFYSDVDKSLRRKLKLYTRIAMKVADDKLHAMLLHYAF